MNIRVQGESHISKTGDQLLIPSINNNNIAFYDRSEQTKKKSNGYLNTFASTSLSNSHKEDGGEFTKSQKSNTFFVDCLENESKIQSKSFIRINPDQKDWTVFSIRQPNSKRSLNPDEIDGGYKCTGSHNFINADQEKDKIKLEYTPNSGLQAQENNLADKDIQLMKEKSLKEENSTQEKLLEAQLANGNPKVQEINAFRTNQKPDTLQAYHKNLSNIKDDLKNENNEDSIKNSSQIENSTSIYQTHPVKNSENTHSKNSLISLSLRQYNHMKDQKENVEGFKNKVNTQSQLTKKDHKSKEKKLNQNIKNVSTKINIIPSHSLDSSSKRPPEPAKNPEYHSGVKFPIIEAPASSKKKFFEVTKIEHKNPSLLEILDSSFEGTINYIQDKPKEECQKEDINKKKENEKKTNINNGIYGSKNKIPESLNGNSKDNIEIDPNKSKSMIHGKKMSIQRKSIILRAILNLKKDEKKMQKIQEEAEAIGKQAEVKQKPLEKRNRHESRKSILFPDYNDTNFHENIDENLSKDSMMRLKQQIYLTINYPSYSRKALVWNICILLMLLFDIALMIIETDQNITSNPNLWLDLIKFYWWIYGFEYCLRIYTHDAFGENLKEFLTGANNYIDLFSMIYSSIEASIYYFGNFDEFPQKTKIFRGLIVLRLLRGFKLSGFNKGLLILEKGLDQSKKVLGILGFFALLALVSFASIIYFIEDFFSDDRIVMNSGTNRIEDIPGALWWGIITITTVGYGDTLPDTVLGRLFGSIALIFGLMLLSIPVAVIGNQFQNAYLNEQNQKTIQDRQLTKEKLNSTKIVEEKNIYKLIVELNELEEANEKIESYLKDNQFLYRSLTRDAFALIDKIEMAEKSNIEEENAIIQRKQKEIIKKVRKNIYNKKRKIN